MCKRIIDLMPVIIRAAQLTAYTCQQQFADRRWNCSSIQFAPKIKSDLTKGTRQNTLQYANLHIFVGYPAIIYPVSRNSRTSIRLCTVISCRYTSGGKGVRIRRFALLSVWYQSDKFVNGRYLQGWLAFVYLVQIKSSDMV
jgi:hypothetical protein